MHTIITVKPNGKTLITKDADASEIRRDVQELMERGFDIEGLKAGRFGVREGGTTYAYSRSQNNPLGVEVMYFKPTSRQGDAKDLFIGNRGLSIERSEGYLDHAYTGDRRRIVVHNHLPRAKVKDADPRDLIAGLTEAAFTKLVNKVARQMDADSDYREAVQLAKDEGATAEQADVVARELGRRP